MPVSSFQNKKELKFVITLGGGSFGSSTANQITLEGYRAVVDIDKAGGMMMGTLRAQIYGVSQSDMNSCVTFPYQPQKLGQGATIRFNTIQVFAIDGGQETLVFTGNIVNAWGNYQAQPDVFLSVQAQSTFAAQLTPVAPTSYNGAIDVATAMSQLASQMGLNFENNGVTGKILQNQYLPNTALEQAKTLAQAAGIWLYIDNGVLAITPANAPRNYPIPLIDATTGMVSYPTFDGFGINFQILFNPSVVFGGSVQISSTSQTPSLKVPINKTWIVSSLRLRLESEKPGGAWFMSIRGTQSGLTITS